MAVRGREADYAEQPAVADKVLLSDNVTVKDRADDVQGAHVVIDVMHHQIHEGDAYSLSGLVADVAASGTTSFEIVTPADKDIHLKFVSASVTGSNKTAARAELLEGATTTGGSTATPRNRNRNSSNTSGCTCKSGVTVSNDGTKIDDGAFGGNIGGSDSRAYELILKRSTKYAFRLTNESSQQADMSFFALWYEESTLA